MVRDRPSHTPLTVWAPCHREDALGVPRQRSQWQRRRRPQVPELEDGIVVIAGSLGEVIQGDGSRPDGVMCAHA